ncbi:MAG: hypothetical protein JSS76_06515 [Bacteroidetes bacterium]|nr:hypothetical protein [Bacteroidota bacterium]
MNILIIYGTTEGQSRKVAEFLQKEFESLHHKVTLSDANGTPPSPSGYDAVIIGASMHMERYQEPVLYYVREHHAALNKTTSAFYSVSLTAASDDETSWQELRHITEHFLTAGHWHPAVVEYVAGALRFTKYDFFKKFILRQIARRADPHSVSGEDKEYTNWDTLKLFVTKVVQRAAAAPVTVRPEESDFEAVC